MTGAFVSRPVQLICDVGGASSLFFAVDGSSFEVAFMPVACQSEHHARAHHLSTRGEVGVRARERPDGEYLSTTRKERARRETRARAEILTRLRSAAATINQRARSLAFDRSCFINEDGLVVLSARGAKPGMPMHH